MTGPSRGLLMNFDGHMGELLGSAKWFRVLERRSRLGRDDRRQAGPRFGADLPYVEVDDLRAGYGFEVTADPPHELCGRDDVE